MSGWRIRLQPQENTDEKTLPAWPTSSIWRFPKQTSSIRSPCQRERATLAAVAGRIAVQLFGSRPTQIRLGPEQAADHRENCRNAGMFGVQCGHGCVGHCEQNV